MAKRITWSVSRKKSAATIENTNTIAVVIKVSRREGQVTLAELGADFLQELERILCHLSSVFSIPAGHALYLYLSVSCRLAGVEGLEPPTPGFGDRCSSQLSYTPSSPAWARTIR